MLSRVVPSTAPAYVRAREILDARSQNDTILQALWPGTGVPMIRSISSSVLVCSVCASDVCVAQQLASASKRLPAPRGKYAVARIGCDWIDRSRPEALSKIPNVHRDIMVYVWYPTEKGRKNRAAENLPGVKSIAKSSEVESMRFFGTIPGTWLSRGRSRLTLPKSAHCEREGTPPSCRIRARARRSLNDLHNPH
jgi:hypothetical protein